MTITTYSLDETRALARVLGSVLCGGEVVELVGDVGSGKTSFTKGLAEGLGVDDEVQSPSFTISRVYEGRDGLELHHYDFYRLLDPGIMKYDLTESITDPKTITIIEWANTVEQILPDERVSITFSYATRETERIIQLDRLTKGMKEACATWSKN